MRAQKGSERERERDREREKRKVGEGKKKDGKLDFDVQKLLYSNKSLLHYKLTLCANVCGYINIYINIFTYIYLHT